MACSSARWPSLSFETHIRAVSKQPVKKSRNSLKESMKTPKVACQFAADGTPVIYHLDF
jgi:hypothetical protein